MRRKNPHAVALGRRGGMANTKAQQAARSANARKGGQKPKYRLHAGELQKRIGDSWMGLEAPYNRAAKEALRRLRATK